MTDPTSAPTAAAGMPGAGPPVVSLSPSRAGDFKSCPMRFRLRVVDRLPERPSPAAVRGTLVHTALERLFDLPAAERTEEAAQRLAVTAYEDGLSCDEEFAAMAREQAERDGTDVDAWTQAWLGSVRPLVASYFTLEDPRRVEPAEREQLVEVDVDLGVDLPGSGSVVRLRGYVDRLDVARTGEVRVVDYKTGASPADAFAGDAMFQLRFYALVIWRSRGVVPRELRLMYLKDADMLTWRPTQEDLLRFERTLGALWRAIATALRTGNFQPRPGRLCDWCDFRAHCPAWGGTPPPYPGAGDEPAPESAARTTPAVVGPS